MLTASADTVLLTQSPGVTTNVYVSSDNAEPLSLVRERLSILIVEADELAAIGVLKYSAVTPFAVVR